MHGYRRFILLIQVISSVTWIPFAPFCWLPWPTTKNTVCVYSNKAMCAIAVGIVGDVCRSLAELLLPYCDSIMNALLNTLQSNVLHRDVKPVIISCFGDIALAIGSHYAAYTALSMAILSQASASLPELDGEYHDALREGIIEAYVGIVQGVKGGDVGLFYILFSQYPGGLCRGHLCLLSDCC